MKVATAIQKTKKMVTKNRIYDATVGKSGIRVVSDSDSTVEVVMECKASPTPASAGGSKLANTTPSAAGGRKLVTTMSSTKGSPTPPSIYVGNKQLKSPKVDKFKPKRDIRMEKLLGKIENDGDIWVERFYLNVKGGRVYYFRSVLTNRCVMFEPPTGSGTVVYWDELDNYPFLQEFATEKIGIPKSDIERPEYGGKTYKQRQKQLAKKKKKQGQF